MAGRKPKPTAQKIIEGNPGRRPLNENEPKPQPGAGKCPSFLSREARAEWNRIVPELERIGVLTMVDAGAIAACCQLYGRWIQLERDINNEGNSIEEPCFDKEGNPTGTIIKINPKVTAARQTLQQYRAYCTEFGLTPSSRSRIVVAGGANEDDDILD